MKKLIIGTLGKSAKDPTCSMLAAHELYKAVELRGFPTFEEAIKELKYKSINKVIVPAAYPNIRNFIMDDNLKVEKSFIYDIPDLVLVSKVDLPSYDVIFLHPATQSLLPKIDI